MNRRQLCSLLLAAITCTPLLGFQKPVQDGVPAPPSKALARIAVVGASASAGYGLRPELKSNVMLGGILDCMILGEPKATLDLGSNFMFGDPDRVGREQLEEALEASPTMIIGIDFMFWFGYGRHQDRGAVFERGLALLEGIEAPLLVGDLPDMRMSLEGKGPLGGPLLRPNMIPSVEEIRDFNSRLRQWAEEREHVTVFPMGNFLESILAGKQIEAHGNSWDQDALTGMLQADLLHPTAAGAESLLILALDCIQKDQELFPKEAVLWDRGAIHRNLLKATEEDRQEYLEREQRRAERKARRKKKVGGSGDGKS